MGNVLFKCVSVGVDQLLEEEKDANQSSNQDKSPQNNNQSGLSSGEPNSVQIGSRRTYRDAVADKKQKASVKESRKKSSRVPNESNNIETRPTSQELGNISLAIEKLYSLDVNRLEPERGDYQLNIQQGKNAYDMDEDVAGEKLFTSLNNDLMANIESFRNLFKLLDNYETRTGITEKVTPEELEEQEKFLECICKSQCMRYVFNYLRSTRKIQCSDIEGFKDILKQAWFSTYSREARNDTSGFEHVFIGEIKANEGNEEVSGLHNWFSFYHQERLGKVDYKGYVYPRRRRDGSSIHNNSRVLKVQFSLENITKRLTTLLIGTSPEFELALYTLCFLNGKQRTKSVIDGYDVQVVCYTINSKYGNKVGTCYVELDK